MNVQPTYFLWLLITEPESPDLSGFTMVASLLSETNLGDALLPFPLPVLSQEGWDGTELAPATYVHHLSPLEIASVNSAIKHFECRQPPQR
jgi:hypothetical protein